MLSSSSADEACDRHGGVGGQMVVSFAVVADTAPSRCHGDDGRY